MLSILLSAALLACPYIQAPDRFQTDTRFLVSFEPLSVIRAETSDPSMIAYVDFLALAHLPNPCEPAFRGDYAAREFCNIQGRHLASAAFVQMRDRSDFIKACGRGPLFACLVKGQLDVIVVNRQDPAGYSCIVTHEASHELGWPGNHPRN